MDISNPYEMPDEFVRRPPDGYQYPPSVDVDSPSSSVDDQLIYTPDHESDYISNGNYFVEENLQNYIDELQFDPGANYEDPRVNEDRRALVSELLGRKKRSRKKVFGSSSSKFKSKLFLPTDKRPTAYLDPIFLKSQQRLWSKKRSKSSTNRVIRGWGKRPLLVESEAPWTPRNRMYLNAIKAIARTRQLTSQNHYAAAALNNFGLGQFGQQPYNGTRGVPPSSSKRYVTNNNRNGTVYPKQRAAKSSPQVIPYYPVAPPPTAAQQQPMVNSMPVDFNNKPLTAAQQQPLVNSFPVDFNNRPLMTAQQQPIVNSLPVDFNNKPLTAAQQQPIVNNFPVDFNNRPLTTAQQQPIVNSMPVDFSNRPLTTAQQQQIVTNMPADFNNIPLNVAFETQPTANYNYAYHPSMIPPSPQSFVYGQINSQGLWVPLMEQSPLLSRQAQAQP